MRFCRAHCHRFSFLDLLFARMAAMKPAPVTYKLEIAAMKGNVDPTASLQRLLKAAKRAYQFRCVRVEKVEPAESKPEEKADED